jgi:hypothetical protein
MQMTLKRILVPGCVLSASLALAATARAGDRNDRWYCVNNCANIPKGALPAPPGTYVNKFIEIQSGIAEADDFVLYKHMWFKAGTELGPLGRYQLDLISRRLARVPFPVVVETSMNDSLDQQRREIIVSLLAARGFTDPSRVVVAFPQAEGLYGDEAPRLYNRLLFGGPFGGGFGAGGLGGFGGGLGGFGGIGGFGGGLGGFGGIGGFGGGLGGFGGGGFGGFGGFR